MVEVNFLAVIIAAVASMVLGFIYYHPSVLGKPWMKEMGYTKDSLKEAQKKMGKMYAISAVLAVITAYVLSHVMALSSAFFGAAGVMTGVTTGFWMWVGFIAPVQYTEVMFGGKSNKLFALNTGYQLASIILMGIVIGILG